MIYHSILGKKITVTSERKRHILIYHPDLKPYFTSLKEVFLEPDEIRISKSDSTVLLFYKFFANIKDGKYLVGVVKFNQRSFVLTAYLSNRKLSGEEYEYEKE
ncbi:hypothetical protein HYT18_00025 [Candidatus Microgenomates bacterium]|nr:hypothetical protein [Candidatus Microgenomates bacterium]